MKVQFENNRSIQTQETELRRPEPGKMGKAGVNAGILSVEINGKPDEFGVIKNKEVKGSFAELMEGQNLDGGELQKKYMAVMSNSMSSEDFGELMREGYDPANTEVEDAVTILDTIRVAVAKGGREIAGFTDDIDKEALKEVLGSAAYAESFATASSLSAPTEKEELYLVENGLRPTVKNLYLAKHSAAAAMAPAAGPRKGYFEEGGNGYYSKAAEDPDTEKLRDQILKVVENAGLDKDPEGERMANSLLQAGIPLTEENLWRYQEIRNVKLPMPEKELQGKLIRALKDGIDPMNTDLASNESLYERAVRIRENLDEITPEAAEYAEEKELPMTIRSLYHVQKDLTAALDLYRGQQDDLTADEKHSSDSAATLRNVQAKMTVETNLMLLRRGIDIETEPLKAILKGLEHMETETEAAAARKAEIVTAETAVKEIKGLAELPAAIIGSAAFERISFRADALITEGKALLARFAAAEEKYETCMTAPRADLGDSIKKAFGNVTELLKDADVEETEETKRAVRILGYNRMEVNKDNIGRVLEADRIVQNVIRRITPAAALSMIRNGKNPLETDMRELENFLGDVDPDEEMEKYSRFLYKLEQERGITEEEKDAYIGIFRMLRQIEKTDGAAIGILVNTGAELNFKNLLSAVRSEKHKRMDYKVDDGFGGVEAVSKGISITEQIGRMNVAKLYDAASPALFEKLGVGEDAKLTDLSDAITEAFARAGEPTGQQAGESVPRGTTGTAEQQAETAQDQLIYNRMKAALSDEDALSLLQRGECDVTLSNMLAAAGLEHNRGELIRRLMRDRTPAEKRELEEKIEAFTENMGDEEETSEAYEKLNADLEEADLEVFERDEVRMSDVRMAQLLYRQIRLSGALARRENYEIPMEIDGEYTSVNLRVIHGTGENSLLAMTEVSEYGRIGLKMEQQSEETLTGRLMAQTAPGEEFLKKVRERFLERLSEMGLQAGEMPVVRSRRIEADAFSRESEEENKISSRNLYGVAKAFLQTLRRIS